MGKSNQIDGLPQGLEATRTKSLKNIKNNNCYSMYGHKPATTLILLINIDMPLLLTNFLFPLCTLENKKLKIL